MRTRKYLFVVAAAAVCVWSSRAVADDPSGTPATSGQHQTTGHGTSTFFDSTHLTKLNVYNEQNENLGKVDDLIIDAHTGQVLYGILDTGLFGKNIPVPWQAVQVRMTDNKYWYFLNKSKNDLANAPTFDRSQWPNSTDANWKQSVDRFFGVHTVARPTESATEPGQPGQRLTADQMILPASKLHDLNVYNRQDAKLGEIDNMIVDARNGQVFYGIMDTGVGGKKIPIPWGAFWLGKEVNRDNYWLVVDKSQDQLANAPTYDLDNRPNFMDPQWRTTVDNFFGVRTAFQPQSETSR